MIAGHVARSFVIWQTLRSSGDGRHSALLEAGAAEDGAALRGLEGDGGFGAAGGAVGFCLGADGGAARGALRLALFAAFRVVFKLLVEEEELFAGGEYKVTAAVAALEDLVYKFHGLPPYILPIPVDTPGMPRRSSGVKLGPAAEQVRQICWSRVACAGDEQAGGTSTIATWMLLI
jgi:hypothetical protein